MPSIHDLAPQNTFGGQWQITARVDNDRRFASEFEGDWCEMLCSSSCNNLPDSATSGVENCKRVSRDVCIGDRVLELTVIPLQFKNSGGFRNTAVHHPDQIVIHILG